MVITRIFGGLGNQMFQYACGRALALRNGSELVLDERDFFAGPGQEPGLRHLNIVSGDVPADKLPPSKKQRLRYLVWRTLRLPPRIVREQGMAFDPRIIALTGDVFLHGYWQSEHYFSDFAQTLRHELSVKTSPDDVNAALLRQIGAEPAVSLHIRRGDYVTNPKANALHGTCSSAYYNRAADLIAERMDEKPVFYVFSDEPQWVAANLDLPFDIRIVEHNGGDRNYEDMRLMSACRHHIVANSSFSWWGAWLNPSESKIVVAPEKWFAGPDRFNPDIIPEGWLTAEN